MTILYAGIDLAKNIFALHGMAAGTVVLRRPRVAHAMPHELAAGLPLNIAAAAGRLGLAHRTSTCRDSQNSDRQER